MITVIGVGNPFRGDDGVGRVVARRLRDRVPNGVGIVEASGEGAELMAAWEGSDTVVVIDAVQAGGAPGRVYRLDAHAEDIPRAFFNYSTHAFSVAEAVELARALRSLPPRLILYGVEGRIFDAGEGLSPGVEQAVDRVARRVLDDLSEWMEQQETGGEKKEEGGSPGEGRSF